MSRDDRDRPVSGAVPGTEVVHRRWLLSKRAADGRPLIIREDKVVHPTGFATRGRPPAATPAADQARGTPALT